MTSSLNTALVRTEGSVPRSYWDVYTGILCLAAGTVLMNDLREKKLVSLLEGWMSSTPMSTPLARVQTGDGLVRRRESGGIFWTDLPRKTDRVSAYEGDVIFSGEDATAKIIWDAADGKPAVGIELSANSLVKIMKSDGVYPSIEVHRGAMKIAGSKGAGRVLISMPNSKQKIDLGFDQDQGVAEVSADLSETGAALKVQALQGAVTANDAHLLEKQAPQVVWRSITPIEAPKVEKITESVQVMPEATQVLAKVAPVEAPLANIIVAPPAPVAQAPVVVPVVTAPVVTPAAKPLVKAEPPAAKLQLLPTEIPAGEKSAAVEKIEADGAESQGRFSESQSLDRLRIVLKWRGLKNIKNYTIEVLENKGSGQESVLKQETQATQANYVVDREDAQLWYQVTAHFENGQTSQSGKVKVPIALPVPVPSSPKKGIKIAVKDVATRGIIFAWERTALAQGYEFEISHGTQTVYTGKTTGNSANFQSWRPVGGKVEPGEYSYRVRSLGKKLVSQWSAAQTWSLTNE